MLSRCWRKRGLGATKEFQFKRKGVFAPCSSQYLLSNGPRKFIGKVVDRVQPVTEGVDRSDRVIGMDKTVSNDMSFKSSS